MELWGLWSLNARGDSTSQGNYSITQAKLLSSVINPLPCPFPRPPSILRTHYLSRILCIPLRVCLCVLLLDRAGSYVPYMTWGRLVVGSHFMKPYSIDFFFALLTADSSLALTAWGGGASCWTAAWVWTLLDSFTDQTLFIYNWGRLIVERWQQSSSLNRWQPMAGSTSHQCVQQK